MAIEHVSKRQPCEARRGSPLHDFTNARSLESYLIAAENQLMLHIFTWQPEGAVMRQAYQQPNISLGLPWNLQNHTYHLVI